MTREWNNPGGKTLCPTCGTGMSLEMGTAGMVFICPHCKGDAQSVRVLTRRGGRSPVVLGNPADSKTGSPSVDEPVSKGSRYEIAKKNARSSKQGG